MVVWDRTVCEFCCVSPGGDDFYFSPENGFRHLLLYLRKTRRQRDLAQTLARGRVQKNGKLCKASPSL
jgi:hypothetical protein